MATAIATPTVAELDQQLNQAVLQGQILEAFEEFYAENVEMQENSSEPAKGKAANRQREIDFLNSVETFHSAQVLSSAVNGEVSFGEWVTDITFKGGVRVTLTQVSVRRWRNGQVVSERFYYNAK